MSIPNHLQQAQQGFEKAITHLKQEFAGLQIGRANSALVEGIMVDSYGSEQPLKNLANISLPDAQTIMIKPWDKSVMASIEKAIIASSLQSNPNNDGECIRLSIPPLTEERRKELAKIVHQMAEQAHISVRTARQKALDKIKQMKTDKEISEDEAHGAEKKLQDNVDQANKEIKEISQKKEQDIMTV